MNAPLPILILPLSTSADSVAEARACGYLPVLTDEPDKVRVLMREESADRHDMLMAAFAGMASAGGSNAFFHELHRRVKLKEQPLISHPPSGGKEGA